jgi:hypothetical protein
MARSRAALTHLGLSLLLLAACVGLILLAWYPHPFFLLSQHARFSLALIAAACIVLPSLTWLVAKPGKERPKLVLDLVVIGLIQASAVSWGMYNLGVQKPYFMVFTLDRFDVLAREQAVGQITNSALLDKPFAGPVHIYANMPTESAAFQQLLREVMFEGKPDIQFRPEFWSPYGERRQLALQTARPLADLRAARPEAKIRIDDLASGLDAEIGRLRFVPGMMGDGHFAVVLDGSNGKIAGYIDTNPWLE